MELRQVVTPFGTVQGTNDVLVEAAAELLGRLAPPRPRLAELLTAVTADVDLFIPAQAMPVRVLDRLTAAVARIPDHVTVGADGRVRPALAPALAYAA